MAMQTMEMDAAVHESSKTDLIEVAKMAVLTRRLHPYRWNNNYYLEMTIH